MSKNLICECLQCDKPCTRATALFVLCYSCTNGDHNRYPIRGKMTTKHTLKMHRCDACIDEIEAKYTEAQYNKHREQDIADAMSWAKDVLMIKDPGKLDAYKAGLVHGFNKARAILSLHAKLKLGR